MTNCFPWGVNITSTVASIVCFIFFLIFYPTAGHCTFERGFCTWMNAEIGDNFDWIIDSAGTPSLNTGPSVDHTTGVTTGKLFQIRSGFR